MWTGGLKRRVGVSHTVSSVRPHYLSTYVKLFRAVGSLTVAKSMTRDVSTLLIRYSPTLIFLENYYVDQRGRHRRNRLFRDEEGGLSFPSSDRKTTDTVGCLNESWSRLTMDRSIRSSGF